MTKLAILRISRLARVVHGTLLRTQVERASSTEGYCSNLNGMWVFTLYNRRVFIANMSYDCELDYSASSTRLRSAR